LMLCFVSCWEWMLSFSALLILSEVLVPFTAHATLNDNGRLALPDGVGVGVGSSPAHRWAGIWGGLGWRWIRVETPPHPWGGEVGWGLVQPIDGVD
jgi:hypothetical protein